MVSPSLLSRATSDREEFASPSGLESILTCVGSTLISRLHNPVETVMSLNNADACTACFSQILHMSMQNAPPLSIHWTPYPNLNAGSVASLHHDHLESLPDLPYRGSITRAHGSERHLGLWLANNLTVLYDPVSAAEIVLVPRHCRKRVCSMYMVLIHLHCTKERMDHEPSKLRVYSKPHYPGAWMNRTVRWRRFTFIAQLGPAPRSMEKCYGK